MFMLNWKINCERTYMRKTINKIYIQACIKNKSAPCLRTLVLGDIANVIKSCTKKAKTII